MPYESFTPAQEARIAQVVQDADSGAWMYVLHVRRAFDQADGGFTHEYVVSRRFSEFKALHALLAPVMGDALPPLPADGLMTLLLAGDEALLAERQRELERIVAAVLRHAEAREMREVREFLGHESISAKVLPPPALMQPDSDMQAFTSSPSSAQCTGSIRRTANTTWAATLNGAARAPAMVLS
jgi:hypothetical protein